jgi:hypothetical protein
LTFISTTANSSNPGFGTHVVADVIRFETTRARSLAMIVSDATEQIVGREAR